MQAARNAGATVVGVAGGAAKVDRVTELGAGVAADYRAPGWSALVPLVQRFALAQAAAAHTAIQTRATVGKTVLVP